VERFHRTLHAGLAMYADTSGKNWEDHINLVLWAYRAQPHSSTGYSPYHLMNGTEMKGPGDRDLAVYERRHLQAPDVSGHVARLAKKLRQVRRIARRKLSRVRRDQRTRHDRRAQKIEYLPGQLVYKKQMVKGWKLDPKWLVPYQVIRRISDLCYKIQIGKREVNLHVEQLKLCRTSRETETTQTEDERSETSTRNIRGHRFR
jgi:hypothetical protein